jgi:palmitoyl-protein thioesterase
MAARPAALLLCLVALTVAYKPVVFMHGFSFFLPNAGNVHSWNKTVAYVNKYHPGQKTYALSVDDGYKSSTPLFTQVDDVITLINTIMQQNPQDFAQGFHFVGHSQGALTARCVLQKVGFNVDNFVSLAGPQAGFYGDCGLPLVQNLTCTAATNLFYKSSSQETTSLANMWRSPSYATYLAGNEFMPTFNNEKAIVGSYKKNFLHVNKMHFFGSPDDGVIKPWNSEIWGFWNTDFETVIPMDQQPVFTQDLFGLQTMYTQGRMSLYTVPGVGHTAWHDDESIFTKYLLPLFT